LPSEFLYSLFGLTLSSNVALPHLVAAANDRIVDVQLIAGTLPAESSGPSLPYYSSPYIGEFGVPILEVRRLSRGEFYWRYDDGTEFLVDAPGTRIWSAWPARGSIEDAASYLSGPVMGFTLQRRGWICLHSSAVAVSGEAVAFLGPQGCGKSTTAAAFARLGYPILSDDLAVLDPRQEEFLVHPGYPLVCLCPDAAGALFGAPEALPLITPTWEKRGLSLALEGYRFQDAALRLAAIYRLEDHSSNADSVSIRPTSVREALLELVANTYTNYLLEPAQAAMQLQWLSRLAARVPLRRVAVPADHTRLGEFCGALLEDIRAPRHAVHGLA
jgi:hypothetical protein